MKFRLVPSPNPKWTPNSTSIKNTSKTILSPNDLTSSFKYNFLISTIAPRPIALISSIDIDTNVDNVAPYSYFNIVCHEPMTLMISHNHRNGRPKDSLRNILKSKEFVVNLISEDYVEAANHSCGSFPSNVSEFDSCGLTRCPSVKIQSPRVQEAKVSFECVLRHTYNVNNKDDITAATVVIAEVVQCHVDDDLMTSDGSVDIEKLDPVSRIGGNRYGRTVEGYDIQRPKI